MIDNDQVIEYAKIRPGRLPLQSPNHVESRRQLEAIQNSCQPFHRFDNLCVTIGIIMVVVETRRTRLRQIKQ